MRPRYYFRGDRIAPDRDLFLLKAKKKNGKDVIDASASCNGNAYPSVPLISDRSANQ